MSLKKEEMVKWLKLTKVPKLGPSKIKKLFGIVPDINIIFSMNNNDLLKTRVFSDEMIIEFNKLKNTSDENLIEVISECSDNNIQIIPLIDKRYPSFLKTISYPPLTLFLKGDINLLNQKKVAIVGSRKADDNSKRWAYDKAQELVKEGYVIVSGGAMGIDYSAHKGAIDSDGKTICVLGSGLFKMFPRRHIGLFKVIEKKGLLISEHLPNFSGSAIALVQRNRITSGISDALLIVASSERGGAMIQTKIAFEQKIPIFCPKRSLNLQPNEGLHQVINEWKGIGVESAEEIISQLSKPSKHIKISQTNLAQY